MKVITSTFKEFTKKKKLRTTLVLVLSESHYKQGFDWRYGKKKNSGINTTFAVVVRIALS